MLEGTYIFFETIVIILFIMAYFTKQEIIWALTAIFSGILIFTSKNIISGEQTYSFPYLSWINIVFFGLSVIFLIFDIFDKYQGGVKN